MVRALLPNLFPCLRGAVGPWSLGGGASSLGKPRVFCGGFPTSGSSLLRVLPAPLFQEGQTVLEGHDLWRRWETVFLQVSGILLH